MYRAIAYILKQYDVDAHNITFDDIKHITFFYDNSQLCVATKDITYQVVEELPIRTQENSQNASNFAVVPIIREHITNQIRNIMSKGEVILEGRDAGSVIYPQAEVKFFIECPISIRAQRRLQDYKEKGILCTQEEVEQELEERDHQDTNRETDPLRIPTNAYIVTNDNTKSLDELIEMMVKIVEKY
jgi:cytidylate kinase